MHPYEDSDDEDMDCDEDMQDPPLQKKPPPQQPADKHQDTTMGDKATQEPQLFVYPSITVASVNVRQGFNQLFSSLRLTDDKPLTVHHCQGVLDDFQQMLSSLPRTKEYCIQLFHKLLYS